MAIWISRFSPAVMTEVGRDHAAGHLGIRLTAVGDDWLEGELPFDERTSDPDGALHGGALAIFAETLGSLGATMCSDTSRQACLGQILHLQHPAPAGRGPLTGRATPLSIEPRSQLWEIQIRDAGGTRVCIAQLTVAVIDQTPASAG